MIDLLKTISCPDCVTQLVGCKKVRKGREKEREERANIFFFFFFFF